MKRTPLSRGTKQMKRSGFRRVTKRTKIAQVKSKPQTRVKSRPKEKTTAKLKKDLDSIFSKYIRAKYPKQCYTCGKPSDRLQCGHYISRQYLVTRWDENNCRPQCWGCNGYGKGQPLIFEENLKRELGNDFVERMKASRHQILKLDRGWYIVQIALYQEKLDALP